MRSFSTILVLATIGFAAATTRTPATYAAVAYITDDVLDVVLILDTATNTVRNSIAVGPGIRPCGVALSPDGGTVYVVNPSARTVSVVDLQTFSINTIHIQCGRDTCYPKGVIVSPDGRIVYAISEEVAVTEIDARTHVVGRTFRGGPTMGVSGGCAPSTITPDGRLLYVRFPASPGFALSVMDTVAGTEIARLADHDFADVVALRSGGRVVAATPDGVAIIDTATQRVERIVPIQGGAGAIEVTPDSSTAYVFARCVVFAVDLATGNIKGSIELQRYCSLADLAVTPDGKNLLVADYPTSSIIVVDTSTNTVTGTIGVPEGVDKLAVTPDSTTVYVVRTNLSAGSLLRVDLRTGSVERFLQPAGPSAVAAAPGNDEIYVANAFSEQLVVVDALRQRVRTRLSIASPSSLAIDPGGNRIFVGSQSRSVIVVDRNAFEIVTAIPLEGAVRALAIAPGGDRLYAATVADAGSFIAVIDTHSLTQVGSISVAKSVSALAMAADGRELYAAEMEYVLNDLVGGVVVIDLATQRVVSDAPTGAVVDVAVSPDGETVYASTLFYASEPALELFDTASRRIRATVPAGGGGRLAITPDGRTLYLLSTWYSPGAKAFDTSTLSSIPVSDVGVSPSAIVIAGEPPDRPCAGDCDDDGVVTVAELIYGINLLLEAGPVDSCVAMDDTLDGVVTVDDLLRGINRALFGCAA